MNQTVSVVTPVFNEEECLEAFYRRTRVALERSEVEGFEIIFVDDGSRDRTPEMLTELATRDPTIKVITLSRNFGHHPAVFAGLEFASGNVVVIVDADLQDPPELIPELLQKYREGYELVFAQRRHSRDTALLKWLKRGFRVLMRRIAQIEFPPNVGVFSAMSRSLTDVLLQMPERERYLVAMQMYLGFRVGFVTYTRNERLGGTSKQWLGRLFRLGMNSLFAYSSFPLRLSMVATGLCLIASLATLGYTLYSKFILGNAILGWASVMTTILSIGTIQLFILWIICEYVDRIFENTKARPYFIIWKRTGQPGCLPRSPVPVER